MKLHKHPTSNGLIDFEARGSIDGQFVSTRIHTMMMMSSADVLQLEQIRAGTTPPIIIIIHLIIVHSSYDNLIAQAADDVVVVVENDVDGAKSD